MESKKDIGVAVKHRLEPFKASPDAIIWTHIEIELKNKKKRRALIFWFSGFGLLALLLGIWLSNTTKNSVEKHNIETEIETVDNTITDQTKADTNTKRFDSNESIQKDTITALIKTSKNSIAAKDSVGETKRRKASLERANIATNEQQISNTNYSQNSTLKNKSDTTLNNVTTGSNSSSNKKNSPKAQKEDSTSLIIKRKLPNTLVINRAKRDSIRIANKRIRDSINETHLSQKRISEEKTEKLINDSIPEEEQSRWSVTPQTMISYYGAFNFKTSDNFTLNYGVLASYRMTAKTYVRIGVRQLKLQQTIDNTTNKLEYLEFPLEIKHSPFNKIINPYFIGGFSYFVLQNANINNLNASNYSATLALNLGLGIETKVFKNIYFNLEPKFNYLLKPFSNENEVKPYILSIQAGLEYRF